MADSVKSGTAPGQDGKTPPVANGADSTAIDKARLQMLEQELEQSLSAVDKDFISVFEQSLTPEEAELQFSNLPEFLGLYESKKEEYLKQKINDYGTKIGELKNKIADDELTQLTAKAKAEFLAEYPDADLASLKEFYDKHTTPAQKEEMHSLPTKEGYAKLYELYKTAQGGGDNEALEGEPSVPLRMDGQAGDVLNKTQETQQAQSPWMRNA